MILYSPVDELIVLICNIRCQNYTKLKPSYNIIDYISVQAYIMQSAQFSIAYMYANVVYSELSNHNNDFIRIIICLQNSIQLNSIQLSFILF